MSILPASCGTQKLWITSALAASTAPRPAVPRAATLAATSAGPGGALIRITLHSGRGPAPQGRRKAYSVALG
jgi:hypothetical protein